MTVVQEHPDYHKGFYDACAGEALFDDCPSAEYRAGWRAAWAIIRAIRGVVGVGPASSTGVG